jgi:hypothetical protein
MRTSGSLFPAAAGTFPEMERFRVVVSHLEAENA